MSHSVENRWMSEPREELAEPRFQFSLATIMRSVAAVAGLLGFVVSVAVTKPQTMFLVVLVLGCVLGAIVFRRRRGSAAQRGLALAGFLANSLIVALYCSIFGAVLQTDDDPRISWAGLGNLISLSALILSAPAIAVVVVLMLRAWTWSAHDAQYQAGS